MQERKRIEMMGLQAAVKTTKRKYDIDTDCDVEKKEGSPPKTIKFNPSSEVKTITMKSDTEIIPPEPHQWQNEPIVDSISKLQAVTETWSNSTIPFNSSANSTLSSLAQTAENITRSTLATTLLDRDDDLLDSDEDDFQEDFDFDSDEDDLLDDQTIVTGQSYSPIRYPSPSPTRQNYIPAYPKPGYAPEPYQNCSRTPTAAMQYSPPPPSATQQNHQQPPPHLRPVFFNGTNGANGGNLTNGAGSNWSYYNHHHQHYDLIPTQQQPQTIRCAENGKSYFELGSSNYCNSQNRMCNGIGLMKNCCEGRNNLWCTAKQCYKEKRLKMMNLSMFKLARFRQASDQSLYRSVLICNTLKSLEKEIELENQIYHQRLQQHRQQAAAAMQQESYGQQTYNSRQNLEAKQQQQQTQQQQQQQQQQNNNLSNESSIISCSGNLSNNSNGFSQPYNITNSCLMNRISSFNDPIPYEHHPLKDPSSGRATPFPAQSPAGISSLASPNSNVSDNDSAFGDADDVDSSSTRSIDWGSVLSLSSQSALDPLSNNDIFTNSTSNASSSSPVTTSNSSSTTITNLNITISNQNALTSCASSTQTPSTISSCSTQSSTSASTAPISSIITTLTTVSSCSLESLTASSISVSSNVSNSNWDFPYLETESSNNSEFYELNCYKLASAFNSMDEFVKSDPLVTPVSSGSPSTGNELEQLTHIMVGS